MCNPPRRAASPRPTRFRIPCATSALGSALLLALAVAPPIVSAQEQVAWSDRFGRAGVHASFWSRVHDAVTDGSDLWVAGRFQTAGNSYCRGIARWDGSHWHSLGAGLGEGESSETVLTLFGGDLIAAGRFTEAGGQPAERVARWDGSEWHSLGAGLDGYVYAVMPFEGDLLAAGTFTSSGGTEVGRLARWTGSAWERFTEVTGNSVLTLGEYGGDLVIAGSFGSVNGVAVHNIARFDGTEWHALGGGIEGVAWALEEKDGLLWVGGTVSEAGSLAVNRIAVWNGSYWTDGGPGLHASSVVNDFTVHSGVLFAGVSGGAERLLRWDGAGWTPAFQDAVGGNVLALETYGADLFVGGSFDGAGDCPCERAALRDVAGATWRELGSGHGLSGAVNALVEHDGVVFAGGSFASAGPVPTLNVLAWNGVEPTPLGPGLNQTVYSLASHEERVVAGGAFTASGARNLSRVAAWNGVAWDSLGSGLDGYVMALVVHDGDLYAGGLFHNSGGTPVAHIARWDGTAWQPVGEGFWGLGVYALESWSGDLYAGGSFSYSGQNLLSDVARWTGTEWVSVGAHGIDGRVTELHGSGDRLLAGGNFDRADGVAAVDLAAWDGNSWSAVEWPGTYSQVTAITTYHGDLIVGPVSHAYYTGADVARLHDGVWTVYETGKVEAASVVGEALFLGGSFRHAGGIASLGLARLRDDFWETASIPDRPEPPSGAGPSLRVAAPFRPGGTLFVAAPPTAHASVDLFDVAGRRVTRLFAGELPPGGRTLHWDGNTSSGAAAAGVYFVRLESAGGSRMEKLVLVR